MIKFGELKKIALTDIWENEPRKFTPWLAENIEELGKALGMQLEFVEREASVGDFSLDLLAKDVGSSRTVVIENQLTGTDHNHLGKLLTYASGFNASVIIWVAESIREEHRQALDWLNQRTDIDTEFFGVVIEVLKIDNSDPAFSFNPIVFPNQWLKSKGKTSSNKSSPKMEAYREYFQRLIDELRDKHKFTNARKGQPQSWYTFTTGITNIHYGMSFALGNRARIEIYIDMEEAEKNKKVFDSMKNDQGTIESALGVKLDWERLDDKRASRIALYRSGSIEEDEATIEDIKNWSIDHLLKFKKIFPKIIKGHLKN